MADALRGPLTAPARPAEAVTAQEPSSRGRRVRISPHFWLGGAAVWCWLLHRSALPFTPTVMLFLTPIFLGACWLLYRDFAREIALGRRDLAVFGGFLALQLVVRDGGLFDSIGGDELYHAERASFLLVALRNWVEGLPARPLAEARGSMWNVFDPRHVPVTDLWRAISFPLLAAAALFAAGLTKPRRHGLRWVLVAAAIALVIVASRLALPPENHPPLRLLPLFLGELVLGLNSFAFRLPGLVALSALSLGIFRLLEGKRSSVAWHLTIAAAAGFIPVVFYSAQSVEASIFGFVACSGVLLLSWQFVSEGDADLLVLAGVIAGLTMPMRLPIVFVWALIVPLLLASSVRSRPLVWARTLFPALLAVPSIVTLRALGHAAGEVPEGTALHKLALSVVGGVGPMSILNDATLPWALFTVLLLFFCLPRLRWAERALYLLFVPAYATFHVIWSYLWPIGRYQAEYVAPFQVLTLCFAARLLLPAGRKVVSFLLAVLAGVTVEVNANLPWDTSYTEWPRMRITTTASFPYRQGLGFLKVREAAGNFALLGGSPWYGDMALWISGHTFSETRTWRGHQGAMNAWMAARGHKTAPALVEFCRARGIRYLVVQTGTRREQQHRWTAIVDPQPTIDALETGSRVSGSGIVPVARFGPEGGGWLEIYLVI
jgi:hypothetical protein